MADSLLDEIDAELRADRVHQLWVRYRKPLFIAVLAIILLTAADSVWQHYRQQRGGEQLLQLTQAQALYDTRQWDKAAEGFAAVAADARGDTRTLAQLWQARALTAAAKKDEAAAILAKAANGRSLWSDLACLRLASLDASKAACLGNSHDSPLAGQRHEWQAAQLWTKGKHEEAITILEQLLTSRDTPEADRARVGQWLSTLRAEMAPAK